MTKWVHYFGVGALAVGAAAAMAQEAPDPVVANPPPAVLHPPPPAPPPQAAPGVLQIRGVNGQLFINGQAVIINGPIVINGNGNGQILVNGQPLGALNAGVPADLPIVNDGFANDVDVRGTIKPLVDALQSSDYGAREDATEALLRLPPGRLTDVVDALAHTTDAESIERLTQAAAHLYLKPRTLLKTRASVLGVWHKQPNLSLLGLKFRMDPVRLQPQDEAPTMTVLVTEIQPGFPATQTLRNGDRIVAMGGAGFPPQVMADDSGYFRSRVAALWPGAVVPMLVLRSGRVVELGVQVAGLPLDGPVTPDAMVAMRQASLAAFLQTLKTGDGKQVVAAPPPTAAYPTLPEEGWIVVPAPMVVPAPNADVKVRN